MTVPYSFGAATSAIPLSQLDSNFNTPITLGNTAIQLGNTVTTLNNMTLANVTISSGNVTITNVSVTTANVTTVNTSTLIATNANVTTGNVTNLISGNVSLTGGSISGTTVSGSTGSFTTLSASSTVTFSGGTANAVAYLNASKVVTTGSELQFDGTNLGLGVTPSAWATITAMQVKNASFSGYSNEAHMNANYYYNAGGKYIASDYATRYVQTAGQHIWFNAPSGTAGNAISFTQAATLTADGDFLVGTTTAFARLSVIVPGGANRNLIQAGVTAATDGLTVKWNNSTSTIRVNIQNLPTSSSGLAAGDLYNDSGTLKVA